MPGAQRNQLLRTLLENKPEIYMCISFWQFMNSQKSALLKAQKTTAQGLHALGIDTQNLGADYLLAGKIRPIPGAVPSFLARRA